MIIIIGPLLKEGAHKETVRKELVTLRSPSCLRLQRLALPNRRLALRRCPYDGDAAWRATPRA